MSQTHTPSGRWMLGLGLSVVTTLAFGLLPIVLKGMLDVMDVFTLTWFRFVISVVVLAPFVVRPRKLVGYVLPGKRILVLTLLAGVFISGNYLLYILGLSYLSPSSAQVLIQQAALFFLLGSLVVYRESFSRQQWMGLALVILGQLLFFNQRIFSMLSNFNDDAHGVLLITGAALIWAVYGLLQKYLLTTYSATTTILIFYSIGALIFLPVAQPSLVFLLDGVHLVLLFVLGLISLVSYAAFAEALNHWAASRVSAILAIVPIVTVIGVSMMTMVFPDVMPPESFSLLSLSGAALVVIGSMLTALGRNR